MVTDKNIRETPTTLKGKIADLEAQIANAQRQRENAQGNEKTILDISIGNMTRQLSSLRERLGYILSDVSPENQEKDNTPAETPTEQPSDTQPPSKKALGE